MDDRVSGNGQAAGLPPRGTGRRRSLIFLGVLLIGLPLAFVLREALDEGWREVVSAEVLEEREVIYIPAVKVFVVEGDPPLALRAVSTHLGEPVAYCPSAGVFMELSHGSKWDRFGNYLEGPAPRGLDRIGGRLRDGVVEINVTAITEGPERGSVRPEHPTGPFCLYESESDATDGFLAPPPEG